jgi:hypothetical protein
MEQREGAATFLGQSAHPEGSVVTVENRDPDCTPLKSDSLPTRWVRDRGASRNGSWERSKRNSSPKSRKRSALGVAATTTYPLFPPRPRSSRGARVGRDQAVHYTVRATFPDLHVIVDYEIARRTVWCSGSPCGDSPGGIFGRARHRKAVCLEVVDINRAGHDGRFVERWSSVDLFGVLLQLDGSAGASQEATRFSSRREP